MLDDLSKKLQPYKDGVGTAASVFTILQFFAGILICRDIYRKKSTQGISSMPFIGGIALGILVLKFAVLLQDKNMFNVNVAAILLNSMYIAFYFLYSEAKYQQVIKPALLGGALVAALLSYVRMEDPAKVEYRYGLIITVLMLILMGAPLMELKEIVKSKDASTIPFPLVFMGFIVSVLWLLYGIILNNEFMIVQNVIGGFLCVIQLYLCFIYPPPHEKAV